MAEPIREFVFTAHARSAMARRRISEIAVTRVLSAPEDRWTVRPGRDVLQARVRGGLYLLRVFVDTGRQPPEVVTTYLTSKLARYEGGDP